MILQQEGAIVQKMLCTQDQFDISICTIVLLYKCIINVINSESTWVYIIYVFQYYSDGHFHFIWKMERISIRLCSLEHFVLKACRSVTPTPTRIFHIHKLLTCQCCLVFVFMLHSLFSHRFPTVRSIKHSQFLWLKFEKESFGMLFIFTWVISIYQI